MRLALSAIADELRRLQSEGVKRVSVSEESLAALRGAARRPAPARASVPVAKAPPPAPAPPSEGPKPPDLAALRARVLPLPDKAARWAALREIIVQDPNCRSHVRAGRQVVVGVGDVNARICFVGEAPGAEEEVQGEPFVGPAGQLLNKMIGGMALSRAEVYIGNIMNWRPDLPLGPDGVQIGNRPPTDAEMAHCLPYLRAQIEIVNPRLLVALGATAAKGLLGAKAFGALGEVRGRWHDFSGRPLMVTYHPSYILRNPTNRTKRLIWEDLLKVMERANLPVSEKQRGFFL